MSMDEEMQEAFTALSVSSNSVYSLFNIYEYDAEESMHSHLISQFQDNPVIKAILSALGEEMDEIRYAAGVLMTERWIDTGQGVQLDGIGDIIGRDRTIENAVYLPYFGFYGQPNTGGFGEASFRDSGQPWQTTSVLADGAYKLILWAKVFKNTSTCTHEDTINAMKNIFDAPTVIVEDAGNAKIRVAIGRRLTTAEMLLIRATRLFIRAGGVGVKYIVHYDPDAYFGFNGQPGALGFGEGSFVDILDV